MQPYFLPYIGYFQLMAAVDKFVLLDDVNYIPRGWINRNRVFVSGVPSWITIPLVKASRNKRIKEIDISTNTAWKRKMLASIDTSYRKSPFASNVSALFAQILDTAETNLARFLYRSLKTVCDYLEIAAVIEPTSAIYPKNNLKGQYRILDICRREGAETYINPPGGRDLYDVELFNDAGIELLLLEPDLPELNLRYSGDAGPVLSILDLMMFNKPAEIKAALNAYRLV